MAMAGLLSARHHVASSLKRRRNATVCVRSACIASGRDGFILPPITSTVRTNVQNDSPHRRISIQALSSPRDRYGARCMASSSPQESRPPSALSNLESRVSELERACRHQRLTKSDVQNQAWPLLVECASFSPLAYYKRNTLSWSQERLDRAKLSNRLLELCAKEVEAQRVFLWEWLQNSDENRSNNEHDTVKKFSPTDYWKEAPHPTKEMFAVVISSWKQVIESCSSFSIKSTDVMEVMESSAQQASLTLTLMEDEHAADTSFVETYNAHIDTGRYPPLFAGAVSPDVRNYSEVIGIWGKCIDGSVLRLSERRGGRRGNRTNAPTRDGTFQRRLQLEASAMKSMTKLLEFMEIDLYENNISTAEDSATTKMLQRKRRPPPDRICYNIILAAMARQANPSLYEMRLVLQRMMERVKFEFECLPFDEDETKSEEESEEEHFHELAMEFFPDVFSYNALIEARANRSAMFASDSNAKRQSLPQFSSPKFHAWQQGQSEHPPPRNGQFSSSEEEAILAENILGEMSGIVTAPVRPNIWSYNAVIKAWLKTDSERGIQRAVMIFRSLALEGHNRMDQNDEELNAVTKSKGHGIGDKTPTLFGRISGWGALLLGKGNVKQDVGDAGAEKGTNSPFASKSMSNEEQVNEKRCPELNYLHYEIQNPDTHNLPKSNEVRSRAHKAKPNPHRQNAMPRMSPSIGMSSRMAWINSAVQGRKESNARPSVAAPKSGEIMENRHYEGSGDMLPAQRTRSAANKQSNEPETGPSIGVSSRMTLINSAVQGSEGIDRGSSIAPSNNDQMKRRKSEHSEAIGRLPKFEPNVSPDLKTFTIVINALARRCTPSSARLAEDLLHLLEESYFDLNPDITIYDSTLNAWARAAKYASDVRSCLASARKAEDLLCSLIGEDRVESGMFPKPNEYSFMMAINALANAASRCVSAGKFSDGQIAAEHAQSLLNKLRKQPLKITKSTIACYGAVIRTWASLGNAEQAQKVFDDMVEISGPLRLDLIHLNAVLDAWARYLASPAKDNDEIIPRLSRIHEMLIKMSGGSGGYNVNPDTSSFNHVIRACYAPWTSQIPPDDESTRKKSLEIAHDSYSRAHRPDAHTYAHIFKAISYLLPPTTATDADDLSDTHSEKITLCKTILQACCRDGHLTKSSIRTLRKMFSTEGEFVELLLCQMDHPQLHGEIMTKESLLSMPQDRLHASLPAEWSRNGRGHKELNRRRQ